MGRYLKLGASVAASKFCEWVLVGSDVFFLVIHSIQE